MQLTTTSIFSFNTIQYTTWKHKYFLPLFLASRTTFNLTHKHTHTHTHTHKKNSSNTQATKTKHPTFYLLFSLSLPTNTNHNEEIM